jgi:hypothetical protein
LAEADSREAIGPGETLNDLLNSGNHQPKAAAIRTARVVHNSG